MLDDKEEKKEEEKVDTYYEDKRNENIENILKVVGIFAVLAFLLIFGSQMKGEVKKPVGNGGSVDEEDVKSYFKLIGNNYSLDLTKEINGKTEKITYITDGTFELYTLDNSTSGYLLYKNNIYMVDNEKFSIKEYNGKLDILNDKYMSVHFIRDLASSCNLEILGSGKATCKIGFGDYLSKYNEKYDTKYEYSGEEVLILNLEYGKTINNIEVDYSELNQLINNGNNSIKYNYKIYNYNLNDFSTLYDIYPDTIKK